MNYEYAVVGSAKMRECLDCAVIALTIASETEYKEVHNLFRAHGRKNRHKTQLKTIERVAESLGLNLNLIDYPAKTIRTLERKVDPKKTYLACVRGHILAIKNGRVEDWSRGRCHRITALWEVEKS